MDRRIKRIRDTQELSPQQLEKIKYQRRMVSNRLYARESRRKKKEESDFLMEENEQLKERVKFLEKENAQLSLRLTIISETPYPSSPSSSYESYF